MAAKPGETSVKNAQAQAEAAGNKTEEDWDQPLERRPPAEAGALPEGSDEARKARLKQLGGN